jgi:myo-inositol 2-dehydrogenase/D-chiro-inositol 1-dehydrogenase
MALVGLGRIGAEHLHVARPREDLRLVAVVEPDAARRELHPGPWAMLPGLDALLERDDIHAAVVASPTGTHQQVVKRLLDAGVHVLCEKPCGLHWEQTTHLAALAAQRGLILHVGYWRRHVPALAALREQLRGGELGELFSAVCWTWDERPPSAEFRASSGGLLIDVGVHDVDLVTWLTGQQVRRGVSYPSTLHSCATVPGDPESASAMLELSGGTTVLITLGRRHPPGELERVDLLGSRRVVNLPYVAAQPDNNVVTDALSRQLSAFVASVQGSEAANAATAAEASTVLRVAQALAQQGSYSASQT